MTRATSNTTAAVDRGFIVAASHIVHSFLRPALCIYPAFNQLYALQRHAAKAVTARILLGEKCENWRTPCRWRRR